MLRFVVFVLFVLNLSHTQTYAAPIAKQQDPAQSHSSAQLISRLITLLTQKVAANDLEELEHAYRLYKEDPANELTLQACSDFGQKVENYLADIYVTFFNELTQDVPAAERQSYQQLVIRRDKWIMEQNRDYPTAATFRLCPFVLLLSQIIARNSPVLNNFPEQLRDIWKKLGAVLRVSPYFSEELILQCKLFTMIPLVEALAKATFSRASEK